MTAFTEIEQEAMDLDWFAVDGDGRLGHFTTGAWRYLPASIALNKEDWEKVLDYFEAMPGDEKVIISPDLAKHESYKSNEEIAYHLKSYIEMAGKGLYSYSTYDYSHEFRPYFCVAMPEKALLISDLPDEIRTIVERTRLEGIRFLTDWVISSEQVA